MKEITADANLHYDKPIRLNKYLAMCGLGSRRKAEALIVSGRVKVDGEIAAGPWIMVNTSYNNVEVDGKIVAPLKNLYLVINKPRNCVCAVVDSRYTTVIDLLPKDLIGHRLFPVGRLDKNSSGLLILTNDGDFAQDIIHPRSGITKTYRVMLNKPMTSGDLEKWRKGVYLDDRLIKPKDVKILSDKWCVIEIYEGKKREIRRMAECLGYKVVELVRIKIGRLELKTLDEGCFLKFSKDKLLKMICNGGVV